MSVVVINKDNFQSEVIESEKPVLLDFWASWCGPCRMLSPIVDEIAEEHPEIKVGKVNVDEEQELATQFNVMSIPSLFVIKTLLFVLEFPTLVLWVLVNKTLFFVSFVRYVEFTARIKNIINSLIPYIPVNRLKIINMKSNSFGKNDVFLPENFIIKR